MKKIYRYTITLDPELMKSLRIEAARQGKSTPEYIREKLAIQHDGQTIR